MTTEATYQGELKDWLVQFHSANGMPKKAVTLTLPEQRLIVQYETKDELPNIAKLRQMGKETAIASGAGAVVAGGVAMIIGRSLLGGIAARFGIAGAFGAIGLGALGPATLVGGTLAGIGYTVYKFGKNRAENEQAQAFGQELLDHLRVFKPNSTPPTGLSIIASEDRRITIIYDPELETA